MTTVVTALDEKSPRSRKNLEIAGEGLLACTGLLQVVWTSIAVGISGWCTSAVAWLVLHVADVRALGDETVHALDIFAPLREEYLPLAAHQLDRESAPVVAADPAP
jgi:hypothetical protein